jgi:ankyrin repeat protein
MLQMASLHEAALEGNVSVMKEHLSAGAAVNEARVTAFTNDCSTALHVASENGNMACVQHLLANGARVELQDLWGHTALHLAAQEGHDTIVEVRAMPKHADYACLTGSVPKAKSPLSRCSQSLRH